MESRLVTLPLQAAQKSMLLLEKIAEKSIRNHRSAAVELEGSLDQPTLIAAFDQLIQHHPLLSAQVNTSPVLGMKIPTTRPRARDLLHFYSARHLDAIAPVHEVADLLKNINQTEFLAKPFDLEKGPLFRVALIECRPAHYYLVMLFHHVIVDETSIGIVCEDLSTAYNALMKKLPVTLPEGLPITHLSPAASVPDLAQRKKYWETQLQEMRPLSLIKNHAEVDSLSAKGDRIYFSIPKTTIQALPAGFSLNVTLLGVFYTLLSHYGAQTHLSIAITSANRRLANCHPEQLNRTVNCFFNSLPILIKGNTDLTFRELLELIKESQNNALKNQLPIDMIIQDALSTTTKKLLTHFAPTVMLVLNRAKPTITFDGVKSSRLIEPNLYQAKMPYLALNFDEQPGNDLQAFLEFNQIFSRANMQLLVERFVQVLNEVTLQTHFKIKDAPLLLAKEAHWIKLYNDAAQSTLPLHVPNTYLEKLASEEPATLFMQCHETPAGSLTYGELQAKVTAFAHFFAAKGIQGQQRIGIALPRSPLLYIVLFALWKLNATVVPLDTQETSQLKTKLALIKPDFIVADAISATCLPTDLVLQVQEEIAQLFPNHPPIQEAATPQAAAYILTTSGTTGTPKAVSVSFLTVMNLLTSLSQQSIKKHARILSTALFKFDPWFYDIFVALVTGGTLHLSPNEARLSPLAIQTIIDQQSIDFAVLLPNVLSNLTINHPMHIISMGAPPHQAVMQRLHASGVRIENGYGPTEAGIELTRAAFNPKLPSTTLGRPLPASNMRVLVINPETKNICPVGVPGEIYAQGPGLALGYLNQAELTAERFPLLDNTRSYATGDFGCYQLDGDALVLQYLGRKDGMVRLHGLTVYPDDIANILRQHPHIKDIALIPNPTHTALWAYVVTKEGVLQDDKLKSELRKLLTKTDLPGIVYPRSYQFLAQLPLTDNGKINVSRLPEPLLNALPAHLNLTPLQRGIVRIFAAELKCAEVDIDLHATYKELGGDSVTFFNIEAQLYAFMELKEILPFRLISPDMTVFSLANLLEPYKPAKLLVINPNVTYSQAHQQLYFKPPASMSAKLRDYSPPTPM